MIPESLVVEEGSVRVWFPDISALLPPTSSTSRITTYRQFCTTGFVLKWQAISSPY